jgi:hypothetical protein
MPAIMLPKQMMLSKSKPSFGPSRGSSSTWNQRSSLYSTNGSVEMKMAIERRQSLERSMQSLTMNESVQPSSSDADDWGFFVDIGDEEDDRTNERTFLNGFNSSTNNKLTTIADSRI